MTSDSKSEPRRDLRCRHCGGGRVVQGLTAPVCMDCNRIQAEPTIEEMAAGLRKDGAR